MKRQQIAVIGLGRFGSAAAAALQAAGHDVIGIDRSMEAVEALAPLLSHVVVLDATDETALRRAGLAEVDAAIVSIAEHLESSILATMLLKRLGVDRVVAKAGDGLHGEILSRVGADQVVLPERDTGVRLADGWLSASIADSLDVVPGYGVYRAIAPATFVGRRVQDLDLDRRFDVRLFIIASGNEVNVDPADDRVIAASDQLVLGGRPQDIERALS
ncbi:MAG: TrkA family potassium uptake protein [Dehalococcoidia bacterium]